MKQVFFGLCLLILSGCSTSIPSPTTPEVVIQPSDITSRDNIDEQAKEEVEIFPLIYDGMVRVHIDEVIDPWGLIGDEAIEDKIAYCQTQIDE
jgi:hypothetical protein